MLARSLPVADTREIAGAHIVHIAEIYLLLYLRAEKGRVLVGEGNVIIHNGDSCSSECKRMGGGRNIQEIVRTRSPFRPKGKS